MEKLLTKMADTFNEKIKEYTQGKFPKFDFSQIDIGNDLEGLSYIIKKILGSLGALVSTVASIFDANWKREEVIHSLASNLNKKLIEHQTFKKEIEKAIIKTITNVYMTAAKNDNSD